MKGRSEVAIGIDFQFQPIAVFVLRIVTAVHGQFDWFGPFWSPLQTRGDVQEFIVPCEHGQTGDFGGL